MNKHRRTASKLPTKTTIIDNCSLLFLHIVHDTNLTIEREIFIYRKKKRGRIKKRGKSYKPTHNEQQKKRTGKIKKITARSAEKRKEKKGNV